MATGSKGFAVTIAAVDQASPTLDKINKHLAAMSAPAERFNKSVSKFADVSGINRMAEGMQTLGSRSLDVFRSLDRVAPALAGITGAASLAGMATLVQRWSQLGQQTYMVGQRLGVPVDKLTGLQGAARGAGLGAKDLADGMGALDEKLRSATFRGDAGARSIFKQLGVDFGNEKDGAANAVTAFGKVADGIKRINDAKNGGRGASQRAAEGLGMGALWPLLIKGSAGINALAADAANLGGVISPEAAKRAEELEHSFTRLDIAVEGVANRLGDQWGQAVKPYIDGTTDWIAKNNGLAESYFNIGAAITAMIALKPSVWVLRSLGILGLTELGATVGLIGAAANAMPPTTSTTTLLTPGGLAHTPWDGKSSLLSSDNYRGPSSITVPGASSDRAATMRRAHDYFRGKGLTEEQTAGVLANIAAESNFAVGATGDNGTSYGLFQHHADRLAGLRKYAGTNTPSEQQQLDYAWWEMTQGPEKSVGERLRTATQAGQAGAIFSGFERPEDGPGEAFRRGKAADQFMQGHVRVDVNLTGAPPGTTAKATASGSASAAPPTVETAMQH